MIVLYHYQGDHTSSLKNVLAVRTTVFANPDRDTREAANRYKSCLDRASGDLLNGLVIYNAGHLPAPADPWWDTWAGNVASYRRALQTAGEILSV